MYCYLLLSLSIYCWQQPSHCCVISSLTGNVVAAHCLGSSFSPELLLLMLFSGSWTLSSMSLSHCLSCANSGLAEWCLPMWISVRLQNCSESLPKSYFEGQSVLHFWCSEVLEGKQPFSCKPAQVTVSHCFMLSSHAVVCKILSSKIVPYFQISHPFPSPERRELSTELTSSTNVPSV